MSFDIFGPYDSSYFTNYDYGSNYTYRVWIPPELLLNHTSQFTITLGYYSDKTWYIDRVGVCGSAGASATYNFKYPTATQVFFPGGVANATLNSGSGEITSQPIDLFIDASCGLILSFELSGSVSYFPLGYDELFAQCVTWNDSGNFALDGNFIPDDTFTGAFGGILSIVGLTTVNMVSANIPGLYGDWESLVLEDAAGGNYCNGVLGLMECEAAGSQATGVIGVLPAVECEATGRQLTAGNLDAMLPAIECEASISPHLSLDAKLPTISCEAQSGSYVDRKLPTIECEGEIGSVVVGRLDGLLPGIRCEAYCGARLDKRIPTVSCEGEITFPVLGWLDRDIPGVTCEGAISGGAGAWLDKGIPVIRCEGIVSCSPIISLDETLPGIRCSASGRWCGATLDARLPAVRSDEDDTVSESLVHCTLDAMLPAVIMAGEGYGGSGDGGGAISYKSRFEDYILRYNRWA